MKPAPFEYHAPNSIEEALSLLQEHGDTAKLLAGGQSLVPATNFRVVQPGVLIDLNRIAEMSYIREHDSVLRLGAMTRERQLEFDPVLAKWSPLLVEAMPHVAHPQIRNRGTLGGSLAHADPAAELPVIMLALGARLKARAYSKSSWMLCARRTPHCSKSASTTMTPHSNQSMVRASCCAAGASARPRRRMSPTLRVTTGSVSGTLTSNGWSGPGIAIAGTAATPRPASTSPSVVVTCWVS